MKFFKINWNDSEEYVNLNKLDRFEISFRDTDLNGDGELTTRVYFYYTKGFTDFAYLTDKEIEKLKQLTTD